MTIITITTVTHQGGEEKEKEKEQRLLSLLAEKFWPGPLTLVAPAANAIPGAVTAGTVRVCLHSFRVCMCMCREQGRRMTVGTWVATTLTHTRSHPTTMIIPTGMDRRPLPRAPLGP